MRLIIPPLILSFIFLLVLAIYFLGCSTPDVNKCTYTCPTGNVPNDCYCLEDEINREAGKIK